MKKHLLTLCLGAAALAGGVQTAGALTASDLIGKKCGVIANGTNICYNVGKIHKASDVVAGTTSNQIIIKDFLGAFDLPLTVNSNGTLSLNLSQTFVGTAPGFTGFTAIELKKRTFSTAGYAEVDNSGYEFYGECYGTSGGTITSTYTEEDSEFYDYGFTFDNSDSSGNLGFLVKFASNVFQYFGSFDFLFFDANDTATVTYKDDTTATFDAGLTLDASKGLLRIDNLFNYGVMFTNSINSSVGYGETNPTAVYARLDFNSNALTISPTEVGGSIKGEPATVDYYGTVSYYKSLNSYYPSSATGYWEFDYDTTTDYHYLTSSVTPVGNDYDFGTIKGTFTIDEPAHKKGENWWVSNGGTTKTYLPMNVVLNDVGYWSEYDYEYNKTVGGFSQFATKYEIEGNAEVTHQVELNAPYWNVNAQEGLYVGASTLPDATSMRDYVDSYDLFVLEGTHTKATAADFAHEEKGHSKAIWITDPSKDYEFTMDDAPRTVSPKGLQNNAITYFHIPAEDLPTAPTGNSKYTLFVRTNYNNGLEPTFHALTPLSGNPTGIDDIMDSSNSVIITVSNGTINVAGFNGVVEVYTTSGAQVYAGSESSISVAPGLYIVKAGNKVEKLNVR